MAVEIQHGKPPQDGLYVVYIDGGMPDIPYADKRFLTWSKGRWWYTMSDQQYRLPTYGWIGPIPGMKLED
jgi:hypothetical protein